MAGRIAADAQDGVGADLPASEDGERHPQHRIWPYLLFVTLTIDPPNQVWCADVTYVPMRRGFLYLVVIIELAPAERPLAWRLSNTIDALTSALRRWRRRSPASQPRDLRCRSEVPESTSSAFADLEGRRTSAFLDGWSSPLDGRRLHRAAVAIARIRMRLPRCLRDRR